MKNISLFSLLTALADAGATEVSFDVDNDGQVILYTNLRFEVGNAALIAPDNDTLVPFDVDEGVEQ